jgi:2-methylcitrate dehydratase PrpD
MTDASAADAPLAASLGRRVAAFAWDEVSERAAEVARKCFADTVGVTLAGSQGPEATIVAAVHGPSSGDALVVGRSTRLAPLEAAIVNGTASHALDFDDFSGTLGGHQSAPITSALLALASGREVSGRDLLTAYVVGCEVTILLAPVVHPHHYDKGWHPTATLGVFGTAAACARLLDLDAERTTIALAIAASLASGLKANFGTMTKPLHVGLTARSGLMAALLAAEGMTANPEVLEHHQGFLEVFNGPGRYDVTGVIERFAAPLKLEEDSIVIKRYACCGSTHAAVDAARAIARRPDHDPAEIRSVTIRTPMQRLRHTDRARPSTALAAKFSVQYVTVRALLDGAVKVTDFGPERVTEPRVTDLLERVSAVAVEPDPQGISDWGAEVVVTYADGREIVETVRDVADRGGAFAMPWAEVEEKFLDCARGVIASDVASRLLARLRAIDEEPDVRELLPLMAP